MEVVGLKDIKVRRSGMGFDIDISPMGRAQEVMGADKLALQCVRAVQNFRIFPSLVNSPVGMVRAEVIREALLSLRRAQILKTYEEKSIKGYFVYKSFDGITYNRLNSVPLRKDFIDKSENEVEVFYDIHPVYEKGEGATVASLKVRPTSVLSRRRIFVSSSVIVIEGNGMIIFRFLLPRKFLADEILEQIGRIDIIEKEDPRYFGVSIKLKSYGKSLPDVILEVERWS